MKLTVELAKTMQAGDYFEYIYPATYLNKNDYVIKCVFLGVSKNKIIHRELMYNCNGMPQDNFARKTDCVCIPSEIGGENYMVWRNGWNYVEVIRINEKLF